MFSYNQLNSNSERLDQNSDQNVADVGNLGLHQVQESMHENNSSPTAEQRMPRINVDQIDGRLLDTIVLPSNMQGGKQGHGDDVQK